MKTDVIVVSSKGRRMEQALLQAEKTAAYKGLSPKSALHLRLLTEETMGLLRSITGETEGQFWIEDRDGVFEVHLLVETRLTSLKREKLLEVSSSGKNESAKGLMGRLRDFFDRGADEDLASFSSPLLYSGVYAHSPTPALDWEWSMTKYEEALSCRVQENDPAAREAWDELEKSVVAKVADDVKVSIRGRTVEMVIMKKMA